mmetsp:Transcript_33208/g.65765  ORF Transcript_33208/g.65765 Transcript_33208/m.65765 type:complete len:90 (-) Transcript_33208:86-355(-)
MFQYLWTRAAPHPHAAEVEGDHHAATLDLLHSMDKAAATMTRGGDQADQKDLFHSMDEAAVADRGNDQGIQENGGDGPADGRSQIDDGV